ncbi:MAG: MIP family protein [Micavibrio sp.]|nr:MAG: MIP family protein [Micavibrio sp.]
MAREQSEQFDLPRRLVAEGLGTALLVAAVVGSGVMGEQLAGGNMGIALMANTLATGMALTVLILIFGVISGAHFNPVVSLSFALQRQLPWKDFLSYSAVQIVGGIGGTMLAHIMFSLPLVSEATHIRTGVGIWVGEIVASFALLAAILGCLRTKPDAVPYAVGLIIMAGYWFTSSTSFANPAVTIARALSDTFSGIRPFDVPAFLVAEIIGAIFATIMFRWFWFIE